MEASVSRKTDQTHESERRSAKEPNLGQKEAQMERRKERDLRHMGELSHKGGSEKRAQGEKKR
jgi:hypothetical protein